jgi:hypothetical protein
MDREDLYAACAAGNITLIEQILNSPQFILTNKLWERSIQILTENSHIDAAIKMISHMVNGWTFDLNVIAKDVNLRIFRKLLPYHNERKYVLQSAILNRQPLITATILDYEPVLIRYYWDYIYQAACIDGDTQTVQYLLDDTTSIGPKRNVDWYDGIVLAYKHNRKEIVYALMDKSMQIAPRESLRLACKYGYGHIAAYLYDKALCDKSYKCNPNHMLRNACAGNQLGIIQWITTLQPHALDWQYGLMGACEGNHEKLIASAIEKTSIIDDGVMYNTVYELCGHCSINISLLMQIFNKFQISYWYELFPRACSIGNINLVTFILKDIIPDHANSNTLLDDGLSAAIESDHTAIAILIIKHISTAATTTHTTPVAAIDGTTAYYNALRSGNIKIQQLLISSTHIVINISKVIVRACSNNEIHIANAIANSDVNWNWILAEVCEYNEYYSYKVVTNLIKNGANPNYLTIENICYLVKDGLNPNLLGSRKYPHIHRRLLNINQLDHFLKHKLPFTIIRYLISSYLDY